MRRLNSAFLNPSIRIPTIRPAILAASALALPLTLAACGEGTDPATTGAVEDSPVIETPADPAAPDPLAPADPLAPPAGDTTVQ